MSKNSFLLEFNEFFIAARYQIKIWPCDAPIDYMNWGTTRLDFYFISCGLQKLTEVGQFPTRETYSTINIEFKLLLLIWQSSYRLKRRPSRFAWWWWAQSAENSCFELLSCKGINVTSRHEENLLLKTSRMVFCETQHCFVVDKKSACHKSIIF